jgi:hypothetical protein
MHTFEKDWMPICVSHKKIELVMNEIYWSYLNLFASGANISVKMYDLSKYLTVKCFTLDKLLGKVFLF